LRFSEECVAGKKLTTEKKEQMIDELDLRRRLTSKRRTTN